MRSCPTIAVAAGVLLLAAPVHAGPRAKGAPALKNPAALKAIITALSKEAADAWRDKDKKDWPRKSNNFAKTHPHDLDANDMIFALTHRLHPSVAIDGYIKWQLLGYGLDQAALTPAVIGQLVESMPMLMAQAEDPPRVFTKGAPAGAPRPWRFIGRQRPFAGGLHAGAGSFGTDPVLSIIQGDVILDVEPNAGLGIDPRLLTTTVSASNAKINQIRRTLASANQPAIQFRDQLMAMIPAEGGLRVAAMLVDLEDRLNAGEPTSAESFKRLHDEAAKLAADSAAPAQTLRQLNTNARQLARTRAKVVDRVAQRAGQIIAYRHVVSLTNEQITTLLNTLRP